VEIDKGKGTPRPWASPRRGDLGKLRKLEKRIDAWRNPEIVK